MDKSKLKGNIIKGVAFFVNVILVAVGVYAIKHKNDEKKQESQPIEMGPTEAEVMGVQDEILTDQQEKIEQLDAVATEAENQAVVETPTPTEAPTPATAVTSAPAAAATPAPKPVEKKSSTSSSSKNSSSSSSSKSSSKSSSSKSSSSSSSSKPKPKPSTSTKSS